MRRTGAWSWCSHGLYCQGDFNNTLRGATDIDPVEASDETLGDRAALTSVALEHPDFARTFRVHATDEVQARYV